MNDQHWEKWVEKALKGRRLHEPSPEAMRRALEIGSSPRDVARPSVARAWFASKWNLGLAAAALLIVAIGSAVILRTAGPTLPPRMDDSTVRSGRVELISPIGELTVAPRLLAWEAVDEAESYRVRILAVDDSVLWEQFVADVSVSLPVDARERILKAVVYRWQVEAVSSEGKTVAVSETTSFRVTP